RLPGVLVDPEDGISFVSSGYMSALRSGEFRGVRRAGHPFRGPERPEMVMVTESWDRGRTRVSVHQHSDPTDYAVAAAGTEVRRSRRVSASNPAVKGRTLNERNDGEPFRGGRGRHRAADARRGREDVPRRSEDGHPLGAGGQADVHAHPRRAPQVSQGRGRRAAAGQLQGRVSTDPLPGEGYETHRIDRGADDAGPLGATLIHHEAGPDAAARAAWAAAATTCGGWTCASTAAACCRDRPPPRSTTSAATTRRSGPRCGASAAIGPQCSSPTPPEGSRPRSGRSGIPAPSEAWR